MPNHHSLPPPQRPTPPPRKAFVYVGMAILTTGAVLFFSSFFVFIAGFIEFSRPGQSFEYSEQVFFRIASTVFPMAFGGIVLISIGNVLTKIGQKGILKLTEEEPKEHNIGFYVEKYFHEGASMAENHSINIRADRGSNVVYAGHDISGTVTTLINQLEHSHGQNAGQLVGLLKQLQQVIESEPVLSLEDKADALEQVKVLAEVGQNPQESSMQKIARNAIKILRGTAASLPPAAEMLKACNTLLPAIAQLLSLSL
jgi:hypothetical protein